jgi:hypothetical protein
MIDELGKFRLTDALDCGIKGDDPDFELLSEIRGVALDFLDERLDAGVKLIDALTVHRS